MTSNHYEGPDDTPGICTRCGLYPPYADCIEPKCPHSKKKHTRDLESALREARPYVQRAFDETRTSGWQYIPAGVLTRIDAALSAASDEESGEGPKLFYRFIGDGASRHARSEAPNVERALDLWWSLSGWINEDKPKLSAALDAAHAEGIAAERERCAKLIENDESIFNRSRIAAAIRRGPKP